jgi:peptidoglycan hydrolase CwlO-like protein
MKTVKDLRDFVLDNEGAVTFGNIVITHMDGGDVDFYLCGNLCQWICSTVGGDSKLDKEQFLIESDHKDFKSRMEELRDKIEQLKEEIKNNKPDETKKDEIGYLKGKIEILEAVVRGRDLIISK